MISMYCPNCGTTNDARPSYCRNCGQSLAAAQLAVDGHFDEAVANFKKSEDLLGMGLLIFGLFVLGALIMLYLDGPRQFSFAVILGLIICLPIVLVGLIRVDRVRRQLGSSETERKRLSPTEMPALTARATDPLEVTPEMRGSVVEHTTVRLDQKNRSS